MGAIGDLLKSPDKVQCFDELSCAAGVFGTVHGDAFIRAVFGK
jgi:2,3-bisphosphoglycerate-independent phosphoglycerate mutase